jgi:hypothetical protein
MQYNNICSNKIHTKLQINYFFILQYFCYMFRPIKAILKENLVTKEYVCDEMSSNKCMSEVYVTVPRDSIGKTYKI